MVPTLIKDILVSEPDGKNITVCGWVRTVRDSKNLVFIQVNDGSCFANIQLTFDRNNPSDNANTDSIEAELKKLNTGASIRAEGLLVPSPASGQAVEVTLEKLTCLGVCPPEEYPLQKNKMSMEYLRENAHLRARTNTFGAVYRMRNQMAFAVHSFFQERGFQYINAPEITCSDCEGAGEMFQVTTLSMEKIAEMGVKAGLGGMKIKDAHKIVDYSKDFFGKKANLTVSGQLEAETLATALSRVYTFGPTFRAENSNTPRHLAEFWMIEPEMAFFTLEDDMDIQEEFIKYLLNWALTKCREDLEFFNKRIQPGLIEMLEHVVNSKFKRISYTDAIAELEKHADKFEFKPYWGCDIATEHERYLTEQIFKCPVMVYNYPKEIKSFYMKLNEDGKTVRAVDVLVPGIGEIIGGSEREENYDKLLAACKERNMDMSNYEWYLDLRRFGTVPHAGFGLGFERLIRYVTGMENIRDVIPYPRAPKLADF
ncbi:MAG: asparagine--tRNA ligase [Treponema porcinum]|uniref:Asparagine--tRNA ligase n=2 Tax=Treponema porcinum TaxID=261392 RepID=A0A1T4JL32_TREPO|nr:MULTISPECIES: asparagine--tRNA ligase [Treponema]MCI5645111.1 asparagine--tRNA ligase [Treponema porcinum]MCI6180593.1 asparagine--tRNA ligase [Treponema porcinum]MDD7125634.1 asparagine--tRNA ligase [Treponema porcinum]MDY4468625.1 asparagine--tRNA ligase [Treponema porcinum]MDY5049482.1 asparagine--tRNA ligase [Treponema porcinum]